MCFGTQTPISYGKHTAITESQGTSLAAAESTFKGISDENLRSEDWPSSTPSGTIVIQKYNDTRRAFLFAGKRSLGSVHSLPIIHFTGARDSPDNNKAFHHVVPYDRSMMP